jgi:oxygen-dependent protoporphyrinogen oxidase
MDCVVVGGGISGLLCAERLHRAGARVLLLEKSNRWGGVIETQRQDGFLFELGPQSFLLNDALLDAVASLGLLDSLQRANPRAPRFIYSGGRLQSAPMAPPQILSTSLIGARTKLRILTEPLRRSSPPDGDESVAAFVRRKFGADLLENLVGPFVSGIHAGDPERLSLRSAFPFLHEWERDFGSVLKGAMKSRPAPGKPRPVLSSLAAGVAALPLALADALGDAAQKGVEVAGITRARANGSTTFEISVSSGGRTSTLHAQALVLATPADAAGSMLSSLSPLLAELLPRIEYASVAVVGLGYRREQIAHALDGFGFLVPRREKLGILGTVWCSSLFPGRAPEGMANLTSFLGGATQPEAASLPEEELVERTHEEVAQVLGIRGAPVTRILRRWSRALPQYNIGHAQLLAAVEAELARFSGLFLAGNFLRGPSIGSCAEQAFKTAGAVTTFLGASGK